MLRSIFTRITLQHQSTLRLFGRRYASSYAYRLEQAFKQQRAKIQNNPFSGRFIARYIRSYRPQPQQLNGLQKLRFRVDSWDPNKVVNVILALNLGIFGVFYYGDTLARAGKPQALIWMLKNFSSSKLNLQQGRVWTLLTANFAHMQLGHLFMNCLGIYFIGYSAAAMMGPWAFLNCYLVGGVASSVAGILWGSKRHSSQLGASGSVCSFLAYTACLAPTMKILLYGIIPMPMWGFVGGVFLYDLYSTMNPRMGSNTAFAGHVGGTVAGVGLYMLSRGRVRRW